MIVDVVKLSFWGMYSKNWKFITQRNSINKKQFSNLSHTFVSLFEFEKSQARKNLTVIVIYIL